MSMSMTWIGKGTASMMERYHSSLSASRDIAAIMLVLSPVLTSILVDMSPAAILLATSVATSGSPPS